MYASMDLSIIVHSRSYLICFKYLFDCYITVFNISNILVNHWYRYNERVGPRSIKIDVVIVIVTRFSWHNNLIFNFNFCWFKNMIYRSDRFYGRKITFTYFHFKFKLFYVTTRRFWLLVLIPTQQQNHREYFSTHCAHCRIICVQSSLIALASIYSVSRSDNYLLKHLDYRAHRVSVLEP